MYYQVKSGVVVQEVDGELLVLDRENEQIHQLNAIASLIWSCIDGQSGLEQIAARVTEKYEVAPDVAKRDVKKLLEEFSEKNLISPV